VKKDSVFVIKWKTHEIDFIVNWYWRMQVWGGHIKFLLFSMAASHYKRIIRCVMCITMTSIDNSTSSPFQFYCCKSNSTHKTTRKVQCWTCKASSTHRDGGMSGNRGEANIEFWIWNTAGASGVGWCWTRSCIAEMFMLKYF
jgi:hypothetical protein